MIKKIIYSLLICIVSIGGEAAIGDWTFYMAYSEVQDIEVANGGYLFVKASNSLYLYNKEDQSIYTFNKGNGMSDVSISHIAWCQTAKKLVVVYNNSNIDLVDTEGNITNIADLYNKTMTADKTVNSITVDGKYAYLATNFGAVKLNVYEEEISESYMLNITAKKVAISDGYIYILQKNKKVMRASLSASNLQDTSFWTTVSSYPSGIFDEDNTDYDENIDLVNTLNPGGPDNNYMGFLKLYDGTLYTCNGEWGTQHRGSLQSMTDGEWTLYGDSTTVADATGLRCRDFICLDIDPTNDNRIMVGGVSGLYEFRNGEFYKLYNSDNSIIESFDNSNYYYEIISAISFDDEGNLWCFNSQAPTQNLIEYTKDGEWVSHYSENFLNTSDGKAMTDVRSMFCDSREILWACNNWSLPLALLRYDIDSEESTAYTSFENQDGTKSTFYYVRCATEDKDNNIWVGTSGGPYYLSESEIVYGGTTFTQHKVPRNDGTNLADYLLSNIDIYTIAVDGANRKWFGTAGNGLYLISSDNNEEIYHFTTENSNILSDNILSLAIDGTTGEVYIGTDVGLCSFCADATESAEEMTSSSVYAYPNPVRPDYTGLITVVGLTDDADVKITTATGYLVYEGRSNGGTFTWGGYDTKGRKVASGVYNVLTAKSDGSKGTVCKIVIVR